MVDRRQRMQETPRGFGDGGCGSAHVVKQKVTGGRLRPRRPRRGRWLGGVGCVVEQVAEQLHAGEAVGDCMMNPDEHADLVAGQSGQQPQLPQWSRSVKRALPQLLARIPAAHSARPQRAAGAFGRGR